MPPHGSCHNVTRLRHGGAEVNSVLREQSEGGFEGEWQFSPCQLLMDGVSVPVLSVSLVVQWVDVTRLEKNATLLFPESIRVDTRDQELFFSMFLNIGETFKLMEQLANLAMRQLLDSEGFLEDKALPRPIRPHKNISALKRYATLPRAGDPTAVRMVLGPGPQTQAGIQHMPSQAYYLGCWVTEQSLTKKQWRKELE